jgi:hypothetical protein
VFSLGQMSADSEYPCTFVFLSHGMLYQSSTNSSGTCKQQVSITYGFLYAPSRWTESPISLHGYRLNSFAHHPLTSFHPVNVSYTARVLQINFDSRRIFSSSFGAMMPHCFSMRAENNWISVGGKRLGLKCPRITTLVKRH